MENLYKGIKKYRNKLKDYFLDLERLYNLKIGGGYVHV